MGQVTDASTELHFRGRGEVRQVYFFEIMAKHIMIKLSKIDQCHQHDLRLNNVLMEFMSSRQHLFAVIDEYGGLSGLIALEDILEEILGLEIMGESDQVADKRELARQRRSRLASGLAQKERM